MNLIDDGAGYHVKASLAPNFILHLEFVCTAAKPANSIHFVAVSQQSQKVLWLAGAGKEQILANNRRVSGQFQRKCFDKWWHNFSCKKHLSILSFDFRAKYNFLPFQVELSLDWTFSLTLILDKT